MWKKFSNCSFHGGEFFLFFIEVDSLDMELKAAVLLHISSNDSTEPKLYMFRSITPRSSFYVRHRGSGTISWWNESFMEDCRSLVGLWRDAAVVAVILLIHFHRTTNGGYKRPQVCPFRAVHLKGTTPNDEKAQC